MAHTYVHDQSWLFQHFQRQQQWNLCLSSLHRWEQVVTEHMWQTWESLEMLQKNICCWGTPRLRVVLTPHDGQQRVVRSTAQKLFHEKNKTVPKARETQHRCIYWSGRYVHMLTLQIWCANGVTCCWTGPGRWCWGGRQKHELGGSTGGCCGDPEFEGEACPWALPRGRMQESSHPGAALARP